VNARFYVVLGNHDYGGGGAGYEFDKGQNEVDYTQHSTKWYLPAPHYRFSASRIDFFALDTNLQMWGRDADQQTDVRGWLAASSATWKIAFGHHPYKSNGPHGNAGNYDNLSFIPIANGKGVKDFLEDIVCSRVDVYICGHDHSRQWLTDKCQGTELIVSGGGASTTDLPGSNPTHYQSDEIGFLYVTIEGRRFTGEFIDANGTVNFTRTFMK
jgi:hypothetical protein